MIKNFLPLKLKYVPSFAVGYGRAQRADVFIILHRGNKQVNFCSILELVRTHFAACGGEEAPPENSEQRRSPARMTTCPNDSFRRVSSFSLAAFF